MCNSDHHKQNEKNIEVEAQNSGKKSEFICELPPS